MFQAYSIKFIQIKIYWISNNTKILMISQVDEKKKKESLLIICNLYFIEQKM